LKILLILSNFPLSVFDESAGGGAGQIADADENDIAQMELVFAPDEALTAGVAAQGREHLIADFAVAAGNIVRQRFDVYVHGGLRSGAVAINLENRTGKSGIVVVVESGLRVGGGDTPPRNPHPVALFPALHGFLPFREI